MESLKAVLEQVEQEGTYVGVNFSEETVLALEEYQHAIALPNPLPHSEFHTTLVYSQLSIPWDPQTDLDVEAKIIGTTTFDARDGKRCFVILLECPWLQERFDKAMALGATYDFPEYKPHITLSYDIGDFDINSVVDPDFPIKIIEEYKKPLKKDWKKD
jgi:hypothetical protein